MSILEVEDLKIWDIRNDETIVNHVSFRVEKGKCLALAGESGSGKSMTVKSINRIQAPWIITEGSIRFNGMELTELSEKSMRRIRGKGIFVIFQDAMRSFDPTQKIGSYTAEILTAKLSVGKKEALRRLRDAMENVSLREPEEILMKYPHQLSGGMLQRIIIAMAFVLEPELIIADEPTTGLDTIIQYEVVNEFRRLMDTGRHSMIFISHDLGVIRKLADDVAVMRGGDILEKGPLEQIFTDPKTEYTANLIRTRKKMGDHYRKLMGEA